MLERARIISHKVPVMVVMPVCSTPERDDTSQTPREIVSRVRINSLHLPQHHPDQDRDQMDVLRDGSEHKRRSNRAKAQQQRFPWTRIFSSQPEWCRILVMDPMDAAVQWPPVECAVQPVVICVFDEEEEGDLEGETFECWKREGVLQAAQVHHRVEEDDERQLNDEVDE